MSAGANSIRVDFSTVVNENEKKGDANFF